MTLSTKVISTGSILPPKIMRNSDFKDHSFYKKTGERIDKPTEQIVQKLVEICEIEERRYAPADMDNTELAYLASEEAIKNAGIDRETLDQIIVAHNFGNVPTGARSDLLPNIAARVKNKLGIKNEECVAYDLLFGCPGWLQGVIQAHLYLKAGAAKRVLVVGADILSRLVDEHDLDSMLFGDGAGATVLEVQETDEPDGILAFKTVSTCHDKDVKYLYSGEPILKESDQNISYLKMNGRGVFRYGMEKVPMAISQCLKQANIELEDVSKFMIHQANGKMIKQMINKLYNKAGHKTYPENVLPLTVQFTGNSSVATIPTLWDLMNKGELEGHELEKGDIVVLASVGAGMHANCVVYKV